MKKGTIAPPPPPPPPPPPSSSSILGSDRTTARAPTDCTAAQGGAQVSAPRILFVITSFDRGTRLLGTKGVDKLDYVLMIADEIREACEVGEVGWT